MTTKYINLNNDDVSHIEEFDHGAYKVTFKKASSGLYVGKTSKSHDQITEFINNNGDSYYYLNSIIKKCMLSFGFLFMCREFINGYNDINYEEKEEKTIEIKNKMDLIKTTFWAFSPNFKKVFNGFTNILPYIGAAAVFIYS